MKFTLEGVWEPRSANFMRLDLPHAFLGLAFHPARLHIPCARAPSG
jgi:hypothetical protein